MTDTADSLGLEHLRHLHAAVDRQAETPDLLIVRGGNLKIGLARAERQLAEHSMRIDKIDRRLERIERRLDLAEA
jgi:hypothetical protein